MEQNNTSSKSRLICFLLCFFLGWCGAHRYYTGKIGTGLLMLFTAGGAGIWWVVDTIFVACGAFRDKGGLRIVDWFEKD